MINALDIKNLNELKKEGLSALTEKLGPIGMVNFIRLMSSGWGDYSTERRAVMDDEFSEKEFLDFIKANEKV